MGAEQCINGGGKLRVGPILGTDDFASDLAIAADQIRLWNHRGTVGVRNLLGRLTKGGEVDVLHRKIFLVGLGILVLADAQDGSP